MNKRESRWLRGIPVLLAVASGCSGSHTEHGVDVQKLDDPRTIVDSDLGPQNFAPRDLTLMELAVAQRSTATAALRTVGGRHSTPMVHQTTKQREIDEARDKFVADRLPPQIDGVRVRRASADRLGDIHVHLDFLRHGYLVRGAGVIAHQRADGRELRQSSMDTSTLRFDDTAPVVDRAGADRIARESVGGNVTNSQTELAYERDGARYRLIYTSLVAIDPSDGTVGAWLLTIDPADGRVLHRSDATKRLDGTGYSEWYGTVPVASWYYPPPDGSIATASGPYGYALEDHRPGTDKITTRSYLTPLGAQASPFPEYFDIDDYWGNHLELPTSWTGFTVDNGPMSATGQTAAVDVHFVSGVAWDFYETVLGRQGPYDGGGWDNVVNYTGSIGSFWESFTHRAYFEIPLPPPSPAAPACPTQSQLDVVSHEIGHGFFHSLMFEVVPTTGELGALDEADSDIIGLTTKMYGLIRLNSPPPGTQVDPSGLPVEWPDAGWVMTLCNLPMRSFTNPHALNPADYNAESPDINAIPVDGHAGAGVINRMYYFLAAGVAPGLYATQPSSYLPQGLIGVTIPNAIDVYLRAVQDYLVDTPQFMDLRIAMELAAGEDITILKAVDDAFAAVHVGPPADRAGPVIQGMTTIAAPGQEIVADVTDPSGVASVQFGAWGTATTAPFGVTVPTTLVSGSYVLNVCANDIYQNQTCANEPLFVDANPPVITSFTVTNPLVDAAKTVSFAGTDNIKIYTAAITLDGTPVWSKSYRTKVIRGGAVIGTPTVNETDTLTMPTSVADGTHTLVLTLTDEVGLTATATTTFLWDTLPPVCSLSSAPSVMERNATFNAQVGDAVSGVASAVFYFDSTLLQTYTNLPPGPPALIGASFNTLQLGAHTLKVVCTDRFGWSQTATKAITVAAGPNVSIILASQSAWPTQTFNYSILAIDSYGIKLVDSDVNCSQSGDHRVQPTVTGTPTNYQQAFTLTGFTLGETCTAYAYTIDTAGLTATASDPFVVQVPSCQRPVTFDAWHDPLPPVQYVNVGKTSGTFEWGRNSWWGLPNLAGISEGEQMTVRCAYGGTVNGAQSYTTGCDPLPANQSYIMAPLFWSTLSFDCIAGRIEFDVNDVCYSDLDNPPIGENPSMYWSIEVDCAQ